jgi:outer membrane protein assembly factor BamB
MRTTKPLLVAFILLAISTVALGDDWPTFHGNIALTGVSSSKAPDTNHVLWTYETSRPIFSSPAVAGGKVYVGSTDSHLYCLDKYTGALIWSFNALSSIRSSPAVADGRVYFLSEAGSLHALNAEDGSALWQAPIGNGPWDWASPAVHDGNVFIASSTGLLYSFVAATGALNWTTQINGSPDSPLTVAGGMVFSGTHNFTNVSPTLVAVNESTGAIQWTYDYYLYHAGVTGMVNSNGAAVVDADGDGDLEVFFAVYNWSGTGPQAVCLDAVNGAEVWTRTLLGNSTSTPAVHDGRVFVGSDSGSLFALDALNGAPLWNFPTGASVWSAPAVSGDGKVCFGSLDHTVYCVKESDGTPIWSYFTGASRLVSSPALSEGVLFVGNENGKVYAFGPLRAAVDIHPRSCPNPLNVKSLGVLPVAILGGEGFDVSAIDVSTIRLAGVAPLRSAIEDVSTPPDSSTACACTTAGADGDADLTLKFDRQAIAATLGAVTDRTEVRLTLSGRLLDGTPFEGSDCVRVQISGK